MKNRDKTGPRVAPPKPVGQPTPVCQLKRTPAAPPVYRPQPTPRVLQRKTAPAQQAPSTQASPSTQAQSKLTSPPAASATKRSVAPRRTTTPTPAAVVQRKASGNTAFVSRLTPERATPKSRATQGVIQRMEGRPKRQSVNYGLNVYNGPSDQEKLGSFCRLARANITELKRTVTVQPYRNMARGERGEETKAFLCIRMNAHPISEGCSGGNQHGEMRCLDSCEWDAQSQGNQYYFVCEGGKESCFLCTAISSLLKIAVAATDDSTYPDYVSPSCLQSDNDLWQKFVGDEAFALWSGFGQARQNKLRSNLGWFHNLTPYWD